MKTFEIGKGPLTLDIIEEILNDKARLTISDEARERVVKCREYLEKKALISDKPLYGITTGFGSLCSRSIPHADLSKLQENLVKSHSCSVGTPLPHETVRLMFLLKAHALCLGHSGVQLSTVERIIELYNADVLPVVCDRGSLGASGDLAPLAKLFLPLIGEGEVYYRGEHRQAADVLKELGLKPLALESKEGLALLNGTQFMTANAVAALLRARHISRKADLVGALSLDAFEGLLAPFSDCLQQVRPHKGMIETADNVRAFLEGSEIQQKPKPYVQDPYSFRCIPQVHGASKDAINYAVDVVTTEINSVTDNPTIFPDQDLILSGGNFHGQPIAMVFDYLAIALAELGNISERRTAQLILGLRGLPEFLVAEPGLNSGFMIPQYAAASMVSQNKMYCFAASSDSIVSSNGQEDHVSMGGNAATKLAKVLDNLELILGIELLNGAQALDFRRPLKSSPAVERLVSGLRKHVPFVKDDIVMYPAIDSATTYLREYKL